MAKAHPNEDIFAYITRTNGNFSRLRYQQIIGAANPFKEGDERIGVAATKNLSRATAQALIGNTRIRSFHDHPVYVDELQKKLWAAIDEKAFARIADWRLDDLKNYLLTTDEAEIKEHLLGLNSDVIAYVVKLMSNDEIVKVCQKIFNPLPGSNIGAKGYMGARLQPNSPLDNPEDIRWQVFSGWSYAVGDTMLGTNPVSSKPELIHGVELELRDILQTFKTTDNRPLTEVMPWTVLAHIKTQDEVEALHPGSTTFLFQSIAGNDSTNKVFDISSSELSEFAKKRNGKYGLYLETGQGSEFTNGQAQGVDMMTLESRKHGLARMLKEQMPKWNGETPWVAVNDVAGFIGPEVFKNGGQLLRVVLEDTLMGKLHGLTMGLDICTVYHANIPYQEKSPTKITQSMSEKENLSLQEVLLEAMKANPAYIMALPTANDPMLSYLTTPFQQHVLVRHLYGYKVNDEMWSFFQKLGVIDSDGKPTEHFGDPVWVYYQFRLAKGDRRSKNIIYAEGKKAMNEVIKRDVPIAYGHGKHPWDMNPKVESEFRKVYKSAKISPFAKLAAKFIKSIPNSIKVHTLSLDREDYIYNPSSGEQLNDTSVKAIAKLRERHLDQKIDVQIVVSDGLNANAISSRGHLKPFLKEIREQLTQEGYRVAPETVMVNNGRVRVGYRIGEQLFGGSDQGIKTILHVIGERPGTKHDNYSVYISSASTEVWSSARMMDHDRVTVVAGISDTALKPKPAAKHVLEDLVKVRDKFLGLNLAEDTRQIV